MELELCITETKVTLFTTIVFEVGVFEIADDLANSVQWQQGAGSSTRGQQPASVARAHAAVGGKLLCFSEADSEGSQDVNVQE